MKTDRHKNPYHGWLVLNKPVGIGSTDAVARVRRLTGMRKIGHAGTLDPFASGVLPLAAGEATKTVSLLQMLPKRYLLHIRFGEARDSDDVTGEVIARCEHRPSAQQLQAALKPFIGETMQRPPAFSALKINGQRAYKLARAGTPPVMTPRPAIIHEIHLLDYDPQNHAVLDVTCGKGVYMRSLARDLGEAVGTHAYLDRLERTAYGEMTIDNAFLLADVKKMMHQGQIDAIMQPIHEALVGIPALYVSHRQAEQLHNGQALPAESCQRHDSAPLDAVRLAVQNRGQEDIAVGLVTCQNGQILPKRMFVW